MKARVFVLLAAIAGAASLWLPWQVWDSETAYGGWTMQGAAVSFGAFAIAAACGAYRPLWYIRIALFLAGMIAVIPTARAIGIVLRASRQLAASGLAAERAEAPLVHPGTGAWLALGASLALVLGAFVWKRRKPGESAPLPKAKLVS